MTSRFGNAGSVASALVALALIAASCTQGASTATVTTEAATTTGPTSTTTTTLAPTTTTSASTDVRFVVGDVERLALGDDVAIRLSIGDQQVHLTADSPSVEVSIGGRSEAQAIYVIGARATGVRWTIPIDGPGTIEVSQPWRRPAPPGGEPVALVWQALGDTPTYLDQLARTRNVTVTSPVCMFVRADGTLSNGCSQDFVAAAQQRGYAVWPAVAGLDADANALLLEDGAARSRAVDAIVSWADELGVDGINVDIEGYREEDADSFVAFVAELAPRLEAAGKVLSIDLIPRTDSWTVTPEELSFWSTAPRRRELAGLADFVILMAYDEHNRFRPAGPVASPGWVEDNLRYLLRYADPHQVVLGVPFYGRIWDPDDLDAPRAVGLGRLAQIAAAGERTPDDTYGVDRVTLPDGRFLWLESAEGLGFDLLDEFGLAGWAAWRLGFDSSSIWDAVP